MSADVLAALDPGPGRGAPGVGSALLARGCAELSARGFTEARLWVLDDNTRARRFYELAGLVPDRERSVYALRRAPDQPPVELPEVRYARRLDL